MELTINKFYEKINKKLLLLTIILGFIFYPFMFQFFIKEKITIFFDIHTHSTYSKHTFREPVNQLFYKSLLDNRGGMKCKLINENIISIKCSTIEKKREKNIDYKSYEQEIKKIYSEVNLKAIKFSESISGNFKKDPVIFLNEMSNNTRSMIDKGVNKYNNKLQLEIIDSLKKEATNQDFLSINTFVKHEEFNILTFLASFLGIVFLFLSISYLQISQKN